MTIKYKQELIFNYERISWFYETNTNKTKLK
jgi:hypothetical protein